MRKFKWLLFLVLLGASGFLFWRIFYEYPDDWSKEGEKLPIVYSDNYDITLFGIQNLHPFDTQKYSKIAWHLDEVAGFSKSSFYTPQKVSRGELLLVHSEEYLNSLSNSKNIAYIAEMGALENVPNFILQERLLDSIRFATGGTILAANLALENGWAINLGGGYHHTKAEEGGGFGFFADVPIAIKELWRSNPKLKVLIVDLDAHQGNGNESIFKADQRIFILDVYNRDIYPKDKQAKEFIDFDRPVGSLNNEEYLDVILNSLPLAIKNSQPDLIIYNAGSDVLLGDPLGGMNLTKAGIIKRDQLVFEYATKSKVPIMMVLSGGYTSVSAKIVGESIENILKNVLKVTP